jgi:hypothetical protein
VDRRAHEGSLDQRPVLERTSQIVAPEARDAGPQAHITRRRVLRLEPADLLDGLDDGAGRTFEQQLPSEERAVERALGQDLLGGGLGLQSSDARKRKTGMAAV